MTIKCHQTHDEASVLWTSNSKTRERYRELNGKVVDSSGEVQYILHGAWDKGMIRKKPGVCVCVCVGGGGGGEGVTKQQLCMK